MYVASYVTEETQTKHTIHEFDFETSKSQAKKVFVRERKDNKYAVVSSLTTYIYDKNKECTPDEMFNNTFLTVFYSCDFCTDGDVKQAHDSKYDFEYFWLRDILDDKDI